MADTRKTESAGKSGTEAEKKEAAKAAEGVGA